MANACWSTPPPVNSPAVPTKRSVLIVLLLLLAACSPRAVERETLDASAPGAISDSSNSNARCEVPAQVFVAEDIRMYCAMPGDVQAFLGRESACQHFAGEEAYDEERRVELEAADKRYCEGRERIFADLYARHHEDCALREALIGVGNRYDLFTDVAPDQCRPQDVH